MNNIYVDPSVLFTLSPEKAIRLLSGAAQRQFAVSPQISVAEALILTGTIDHSLNFMRLQAETDIAGKLSLMVDRYVAEIAGVLTGVCDDSFSSWLADLRQVEASSLVLQAYYFGIARTLASIHEALSINITEYFQIENTKACGHGFVVECCQGIDDERPVDDTYVVPIESYAVPGGESADRIVLTLPTYVVERIASLVQLFSTEAGDTLTHEDVIIRLILEAEHTQSKKQIPALTSLSQEGPVALGQLLEF